MERLSERFAIRPRVHQLDIKLDMCSSSCLAFCTMFLYARPSLCDFRYIAPRLEVGRIV